jgi:hypothetical protein
VEVDATGTTVDTSDISLRGVDVSE